MQDVTEEEQSRQLHGEGRGLDGQRLTDTVYYLKRGRDT